MVNNARSSRVQRVGATGRGSMSLTKNKKSRQGENQPRIDLVRGRITETRDNLTRCDASNSADYDVE